MELGQSAGIVLKVFPHKHVITLFDRELGVIDALADLSLKIKRLCNGAHIVYVPQAKKNKYVLHNLDFVHVPFDWARQDILFLHHVLEMVFYFLPPGTPQSNIFNLIRKLYLTSARNSALFKRKFLIHFFLLLGMYPDDEALFKRMHKIIEKPVDGTVEESLHLDAEHIDAWLRSCMRLHPYNELFKTSHFLKNRKT